MKMSSLSRLFGSKKQDVKPEHAMEELRRTSDQLTKKQAYLETKIQNEIMNAKKYGMKNKRAALSCLQRKKTYEKQLAQIDRIMLTLETQMTSLDSAATNVHVFEAIRTANKALQSVHKNMNADKVHDAMDDIAEQQELANEITDAISQPFGNVDYDDDDLLKELEELQEEELNRQLLDVGGLTEDLPSVPVGEPVSKSKARNEEEEELSKLMAWST